MNVKLYKGLQVCKNVKVDKLYNFDVYWVMVADYIDV